MEIASETERKYDVPEAFTLPALIGAAGSFVFTDPSRDLDGFDRAAASEHRELYPIRLYLDKTGQEMTPEELAKIGEQWKADRDAVLKRGHSQAALDSQQSGPLTNTLSLDPLKALEMGKAGDVIVVDAGGDTETSVCGGLMGGLAKNRGIRGMIVDGAGRDIDELEDIGWPIWTRAIVARGTHTMFSGRKEELSINVPIACGGVTVLPGQPVTELLALKLRTTVRESSILETEVLVSQRPVGEDTAVRFAGWPSTAGPSPKRMPRYFIV